MRITNASFRRFALTWVLLASGSAQADSALVEKADSATGLAAFEILDAGTRIELSGGLEIELGYFQSCVREQIRGGTVTIGEERSQIDSGTVERSALDCAPGVKLNAAERQESGASAWRVPVGETPLLLDNLSPVFVFRSPPGTITIQRTDRPADRIVLAVPGGSVDLAALGIKLASGGIYDISAGETTRRIEIDFDVTLSGGPAFKRLVRF